MCYLLSLNVQTDCWVIFPTAVTSLSSNMGITYFVHMHKEEKGELNITYYQSIVSW